jgi:N4-gp56 family major capsid protein
MAYTTVHSANVVEQWDSEYFAEYVRASQFRRYMGTDANSLIQLKENLTKQKGDKITVSLVRKLRGAGVTGSTTLVGNEESMANYGHQITVDMLRNAVATDLLEEQRTAINLREAAKAGLKLWSMEKLRDAIIDAMMSPVVDGKTTYAAASEAQKDTWLAANADRVLFGAAKSNNAANDHSTCLANIDNTNDKLTPANISILKRMLRTAANGAVRPMMVDEDGEWFVLFAHSLAFRDLKLNATMINAHQYASDRGKNNPLFTDGDLMWDGVIVKEIPEIPTVGLVGAGSIQVVPNFMCGAQSVGIGWAQRTKSYTDMRDYDFVQGVAVAEIRGVEKLMFNSVQHGMGTLYTAGVADT